MNIEQFAYRLGRLRRALSGEPPGLTKGVDMSLMDPMAWIGESSAYAAAMGKKPATKADYIAQFTSWVYVCAKLNAMSVASVPLRLYVTKSEKGQKFKTIGHRRIDKRRTRDLQGRKNIMPYMMKSNDPEAVDEVTSHPFLDLMTSVNPFMNSSDIMELLTVNMDLTGDAFWYVVKGAKLGQPVELWPIPSQYIKPIAGESLDEYIKGYKYERGRVRLELSLDEVVRFSYPNPANELQGKSCVSGICDAVYTNSKMYEYEQNLFEQKARTGGVMESEGEISETEVRRLAEDLKQKYAGTANSGKTLILPPGLKFVKDAFTNEEMSFIEGRKLTREEIFAGFDIPTALIDPNSIRSNVEGAQYFHAKYGIEPRLRKIEEKLNEKLLPMFDDSGRLFCAFDSPVPEDKAFVLQEREVNVRSAVSTINEERADLGKDPVDGGDEPLVSSLLVPLSEAVKPKPEMPAGLFGRPAPEGGSEPADEFEDAEGDESPEDEAEKLAALTIAKLKEKLGVK